MKWWQVALLAGWGLTLILAAIVLRKVRGDSSEWARRMRRQSVGMVLMVSVIPAWLFLENKFGVVPYIIVLLLLVGFGVTLYLRGGGWSSTAKP